MYRRRRGAAVAAAATALLVLAACSTSSGGGGDGGSTTQASVSGKAQPTAKKTLTIWVPSLLAKASKAFPQRFAQSHSGVTVKIVTIPDPFESNLLAKWTAGDRPDVLYFHGIGNWLAQLNPAKNLVDLTSQPFVAKTKSGLLANSTTSDGKVYGALVDAPAVDGIFYNKNVFAKYDLRAPNNFNDFLQLCSTLKSKAPNVTPVDMAGADQWPLQIIAFELFNDAIKANPQLMQQVNENKAHFTDPAFTAGYQGLDTLNKQGCFGSHASTETFENTQKNLMSGASAMMPALTQLEPILADGFGQAKVNSTVGFFPLAKTSTVSSWQMTAEAVYVPKGSNQDLGVQYVDWLTGPAYQDYVNATKQYPDLNGVTAPSDIAPVLQQAQRFYEADTVPQFQQTLKADYGAFQTYLSDMLFAGKSVASVGQRMQQTFARNARAENLPGF
jgi:raffinose/stachyose/melibiose transport system substrate-binding protein